MSFQPNRLVLESGQRLVVEQFSRIPGYRLALRPARKRLFTKEPEISTLFVELNKPAFAALVSTTDPEAKPLIVFETDTISAGIRDVYRKADIPFVEADTASGRGVLKFERMGFTGKLTFDDRGEAQAIESIMMWAEAAAHADRGPLVRTDIEKSLVEAFESFGEQMGISIHHHVPFGYAAGYRQDLPRVTARHTIELSVVMRPEVDAEAPVVLPIRVELDQEEDRDPDAVDRDIQVAEFVCAVGMPMAAIQHSGNGSYCLTYSLDGFDATELGDQPEDWVAILKEITTHALETTGRLEKV